MTNKLINCFVVYASTEVVHQITSTLVILTAMVLTCVGVVLIARCFWGQKGQL